MVGQRKKSRSNDLAALPLSVGNCAEIEECRGGGEGEKRVGSRGGTTTRQYQNGKRMNWKAEGNLM